MSLIQPVYFETGATNMQRERFQALPGREQRNICSKLMTSSLVQKPRDSALWIPLFGFRESRLETVNGQAHRQASESEVLIELILEVFWLTKVLEVLRLKHIRAYC